MAMTISNLDGLQETYLEELNTMKEFIKWYSGMEQQKIDSAFQRFLKEKAS